MGIAEIERLAVDLKSNEALRAEAGKAKADKAQASSIAHAVAFAESKGYAKRPEDGHQCENLQMPDGSWVIADGAGFRLCPPELARSPFLFRHLLETGNARHTRQLLAGALAAGLEIGRRTAAVATPATALSLERHVYSLVGTYQTTRATPGIMRNVAERFRAQGNARVAGHCLGVADEEEGHDLLALKDLEALGLRSAELVAKVRPPHAVALVDLFSGLAGGAHPISVLGYAYGLERFALFNTREAVAAVEALVPPGTMATRCLRVHSAFGTDARHVDESLDFIAGLEGRQGAYRAGRVRNGGRRGSAGRLSRR